MTKNDRFKTYTQLEKIGKRLLSRSLPGPEELRNLETECREILLTLARDGLLKNCSSDDRVSVRYHL